MAKKKEVVITCNATNVKTVIEGLERGMAALAKEEEKLLNTIKQRGYAENDEKKRLKELEKGMDAMRTNIQKNKDEMKKYGEVMKDLAGAKTKDLKKALQEGKRALDNMSAKDPKRQQLVNDLKKIQTQIEANTGAIKKQSSAFGTLGTTMKNLFAYAGIFAGFNMLKTKLTEAYEANKRFSDSMANVRKVSGLAMEDIAQLANNLSKIDSRTSLEGLMNLSYTGAKLGFGNYGIEGLESFAKSAVKVQNALSEDMGEDSMTALSKLVEVMGLIPKMGVERAMDAAGSAIFKLASTSTATGTNIIEFTKRLMGLANVSHVTTSELLALGSASDSMGLMAEVSATAFNKVFTSIQSNTRGIEDALKFTKGELTELINQGRTMDAIVNVFDRMHGMSMDELKAQGVFKALGSDGARLNNVMITMANRIDMLREHLTTSNQAFEEGTAVAQEYAIQMDTAAAYSERAANIWQKAFVNPEGVDTVKEFTKAWYEISKSMTSNKAVMAEIKFILAGIMELMKGIVYLLPSIIMGLSAMGGFRLGAAIATGLKPAWDAIRGMTASVAALRVGWAALSTVARANIFGAAVTAIFALVEVIGMFNKKVKEASGYMENFKRDLSDLNIEYGKGESELRRYRRAIDEANVGTKQRAAAIAQFNQKFKPYLSNLLTEKSTALDVAKAYQEVCKQMRTKLALQLKEKDIEQQVMPREQWTAQRREEYDKRAREAGMGQYGSAWITGYAQDNRGRNVNELVRELGKQYYNLPQKVIDEIVTQATAGAREFNNHGNIINSKYLKQANALLAAGSYLRQDRSTENAMRQVNKKWKPEQDAMDAYLAAQQQEEPITPIDDTRLTKEEIAEAKKAEMERKQALRKELQDAQRDSDAIISKIEEWYRLQETAITGFAADGKWTQKQADVMIDQLNIAKNQALANARRGISGRDEKSWEVYKKNIGDLMFDTSDMSKHLLEDILNVRLENVRTALGNIDKAGVEGISSTAMRDRLNKNAAGNIREVERIQKKTANEVEKMLKEYDYLTKAIDAFDNRLTQLGLLSESARAAAKRIQDAVNANPVESLKPGYQAPMTEEEVQQQRRKGIETAASKFIRSGAESMTVNYEDHNALAEWLRSITDVDVVMGSNGMEFKFAEWAEPFKEDFDRWLRDSKGYKAEMQAFYLSLVQMSDDYYDAVKKSADREKALQEKRFRAAGYRDAEDRADKNLELQGKMQNVTGEGQNILQQNGLQDSIATDPEIQRIQNHIFWRNKEYEDARANLDRMIALQEEKMQKLRDNNASEQEIEDLRVKQSQERAGLEEFVRQRETSLLEESVNLSEKVFNEISNRVSKIQQLSQPIADFAENAGMKLGDMMFNMESQSMTWNHIWKNMVLAMAQSTIKMGAQWLTQKIQQALFYKQMEADETMHQTLMTMIALGGATARMEGEAAINSTRLAANSAINAAEIGEEVSLATILTMLGISKGAAKIIGTLGWWGIPLIAVISSLLMGLLASALSTAGAESNAATSATKKAKLTSGMLTYDEGNVQTVVGDDGHVYRARSQKSLPEGVGIVKSPIATTVNGQQALVGERGPEIVIGRKTTRALMMNRPDILQALNTVDRGITTRRVRTFDEGNISDLASVMAQSWGQAPGSATTESQSPSTESAERDAMLVQTMQQMLPLMQGMVHLLENPVAPEIAMYGENGLHKKMKKADAFYARYGD